MNSIRFFPRIKSWLHLEFMKVLGFLFFFQMKLWDRFPSNSSSFSRKLRKTLRKSGFDIKIEWKISIFYIDTNLILTWLFSRTSSHNTQALSLERIPNFYELPRLHQLQKVLFILIKWRGIHLKKFPPISWLENFLIFYERGFRFWLTKTSKKWDRIKYFSLWSFEDGFHISEFFPWKLDFSENILKIDL